MWTWIPRRGLVADLVDNFLRINRPARHVMGVLDFDQRRRREMRDCRSEHAPDLIPA